MKPITIRALALCLLAYHQSGMSGPYTIPKIYGQGDALTANDLNTENNDIKTAVDGNHARISALESKTTETYTVVHHALPNTCQRSDFNLVTDPHLQTGALHPPTNRFGPSIYSTDIASVGDKTWFCPITLDVPSNKTITLTGATLAFYDNSGSCSVGGRIYQKAFGTQNIEVLIAEVYSASSVPSAATTEFPAFAPQVLDSNNILWVTAIINWQSTTSDSSPCRYSGVQLTYTVSPK